MTKKFGFWTLTFLVIANMIGAGVFTTSGFSLAALGSANVVLAAWLLGGLIALAGAASYGMLIQRMPESGGEYTFLKQAAHPWLGFIAGWVSIITGFSGAIALAALAMEGYLLPDESRPNWLPSGTIAVAAIITTGLFHGVRAGLGATAQNLVVLLKLGLLLILLLFAATKLGSDTWQGWPATPTALQGWPFAAEFASSLMWISLSYLGFNAAIYVAGEVADAEQIIPRALITGTVAVTLLYLLLNAIFVYAPPADKIMGVKDVAAVSAFFLGGSHLENFIRATIAISLLTSVFSMMMAAPRVYAKMADDGLLPSILSFSGDSPQNAIITQTVLAVAIVLMTDLRGLLSYLGVTLSLCAACSVGCLFLPSVRQRSLLHPLHAIPAFYIVATLASAGLMAFQYPLHLLGTLLTVVIGSVAYIVTRWMTSSSSPSQ